MDNFNEFLYYDFLALLEQLLIDGETEITNPQNDLLDAVRMGRPALVEYLIGQCANPNGEERLDSRYNVTYDYHPLLLADSNNFSDVFDALVENGADVNAVVKIYRSCTDPSAHDSAVIHALNLADAYSKGDLTVENELLDIHEQSSPFVRYIIRRAFRRTINSD